VPTGGASGLRLFIDKFFPKDNQNIIAILDSDLAGNTEIKEVLKEYEQKSLEKDGFARIKNSENTYLLKLPKIERIDNTQFEIEDYFPINKLIEISKQLIDNFQVIKQFNLKKDTVKRKLMKEVENYEKEDFKDFKPLLDLILNIKEIEVSKEKKKSKSKNNPIKKKSKESDLFFMKRKRIEAKGTFNPKDQTFKLLKGSEAIKEYTPGAKKELKNGVKKY